MAPSTSATKVNLRRVYAAEALGSVAGALLTVSLPFFMHARWGWQARDSLLLAAGQGLCYVLGALSAERISRGRGRRTTLILCYLWLTVLGFGLAGASLQGSAVLSVMLALGEMMLMGASWPMLESLVSSGADTRELSRRLGRYNITWAVAGALSLAASGAMIQYAPPWVFFLVVAGGHGLAGLVIASTAPRELPLCVQATTRSGRGASDQVETKLLGQRRLALWLARIALPATYVVVFTLAPMLPSLRAVERLPVATATLASSVWLVFRALAFLITAKTTFWHSRPILLFWSSVVMLASFLATLLPSFSGLRLDWALGTMIFAQAVLGLSMGMIYSGSLYFGMVLGDGGTEHGGYHEALIGLGQCLGPAVGAAMQWIEPGDLRPGILAISGLIGLSVLLSFGALWRTSGQVEQGWPRSDAV